MKYIATRVMGYPSSRGVVSGSSSVLEEGHRFADMTWGFPAPQQTFQQSEPPVQVLRAEPQAYR